MRNWSVEEETGKPICPSKDDELDAQKVAQTIGIPFEVVSKYVSKLKNRFTLRRSIGMTCLIFVCKLMNEYVFDSIKECL